MNPTTRPFVSVNRSMVTALLLAVSMTSHADGTAPAEIEILKFQFIPQEITITAGTTVRWTNKEKRQYHSVWFEQAGDPEPAYFFPGETFQRTFDKPGVYPYRCGPHPKMTGTVRVEWAETTRRQQQNHRPHLSH